MGYELFISSIYWWSEFKYTRLFVYKINSNFSSSVLLIVRFNAETSIFFMPFYKNFIFYISSKIFWQFELS